VSAGYLLWVYARRPAAFARLRCTLLIATAVAMLGYLGYPTAPPRLAGIGIVDTVSNGHVDLNTGLVHSLYNPFAAVPSMHFGYALVIGLSAAVRCRHLWARALGIACPVFILIVIVATANHFLFDAITGAMVAGAAALIAGWLTRDGGAVDGLRGCEPRPQERGDLIDRVARFRYQWRHDVPHVHHLRPQPELDFTASGFDAGGEQHRVVGDNLAVGRVHEHRREVREIAERG
jgi:hypothetical protein